MNDSKEFDHEAQLRHLVDELDEVTPTDEEAQAICEQLGVDLGALHQRILAMVDAHEAGELPEAEERPPESHARDRRTHGKVPMPAPDGDEPAEPLQAEPVHMPLPEMIEAMERIMGTLPSVQVKEKPRAVQMQRRDPRGRRRR